MLWFWSSRRIFDWGGLKNNRCKELTYNNNITQCVALVRRAATATMALFDVSVNVCGEAEIHSGVQTHAHWVCTQAQAIRGRVSKLTATTGSQSLNTTANKNNSKLINYTYVCHLEGFGLMGWKCIDDNLHKMWATAKLRLWMNRVLCSVLLLATYMNSLFRTGVPPPSHLTKTGFLKRASCEHRQTFLSQWTHSAQTRNTVRVAVMQWHVVAELLEKHV